MGSGGTVFGCGHVIVGYSRLSQVIIDCNFELFNCVFEVFSCRF